MPSQIYQAQNRRAQDFTNQQQIANMQAGLGQAQMGLSDFARTGMGADIQALGTLGGIQQSHQQPVMNDNQPLF